jgi:hypothetical protein
MVYGHVGSVGRLSYVAVGEAMLVRLIFMLGTFL